MSSATRCYDLSGFLFMYQSQNLEYQQAITVYQRVQAFNSNVSTLRAEGQTGLTYYQFLTNQEKTYYDKGRFLLIQSYPGKTFAPVEQN